MPAPVSTTTNAAGNRLASATLAASATTTFTLDYSAKVGGTVQVSATFGTVSATAAGIQVDVFRRVGTTPGVDTQSALPAILSAVASTTQVKSIALTTGRYTVKLTNLDSTNSVTAVQATDETIDSYT